jgi:hypothetical protein
MSLNTNGWDYIYTATIKKLNDLMETSGHDHLQTLIDPIISDGSNQFTNFTLTKCEVIASEKMTDDLTGAEHLLESTYPDLYLKYTCTGIFGTTTTFTDLVFVIRVNINWLNKTQYYLTTPSDLVPRYDFDSVSSTLRYADISLVLIQSSTLTTFLNTVNELLKNYINEKVSTSKKITNPSNLRYDKYYKFFIGLNPFGKDGSSTEWMKTPKVQMLSVKYDVNQKITNQTCFFSFSCMIRKFIEGTNSLTEDIDKTSKVKNKDLGYVDLNAIPDGASSALVIERGVFAEHMVKAAFANGDKLFDKAATVLDKSGAYSFSNNIEVTLKSKDYKDEDENIVSGKVAQERLLISVEESNIKLSMGDVEYTFNDQNSPTINQEYVFNLEWATENNKIKTKAKEKLFIISNTFSPNTTMDWLLNTLGPIFKNFVINFGSSALYDRYSKKNRPNSFKINSLPYVPRTIPIEPETKLLVLKETTTYLKPAPKDQPVSNNANVQLEFVSNASKAFKRTFLREKDNSNNKKDSKKNNFIGIETVSVEKKVQSSHNNGNIKLVGLDESQNNLLSKKDKNNAFNSGENRNSSNISFELDYSILSKDQILEEDLVEKTYLMKFDEEVENLLEECKFLNSILAKINGKNGHQYDYEFEIRFREYIKFLNSINDIFKKVIKNNNNFLKDYQEIIDVVMPHKEYLKKDYDFIQCNYYLYKKDDKNISQKVIKKWNKIRTYILKLSKKNFNEYPYKIDYSGDNFVKSSTKMELDFKHIRYQIEYYKNYRFKK